MKKNWIILTLSIMLILTSCKTPLKVYAVNDKVNNCKYILEFVSVEQTKFSFNFTVLNKNMNNDSFYDRVVVDFSRTDGVIFHYTIFIDG
ncbi:MAG: hypothetical protein LBV58_03560, partial [Acholeplasmatales bacterium]|nr:hypothetical protein [Acholeplasmatales bacterium]